MDDKRLLTVENKPQELSPPAGATDGAAGEAFREGDGATGGAGMEDTDCFESVPYQESVKPAPNDLNFRQFGQCFLP